MEMSIPALYKVNQWYTEIIAQYTNPCPLISGHEQCKAASFARPSREGFTFIRLMVA
uniref:Uncharacterized protein n=1 Tax=Amphimedon queenslandica TaxID=400682 RepID=A0A1X7T470_AMPQE